MRFGPSGVVPFLHHMCRQNAIIIAFSMHSSTVITLVRDFVLTSPLPEDCYLVVVLSRRDLSVECVQSTALSG